MPTLLDKSYAAVANTSYGGAGTTTGSDGALVDVAGSKVRVVSGELAILNSPLPGVFHGIARLGSSGADLNQSVTVHLPAGIINGDGGSVLLRINPLPSWPGDNGYHFLHFFRGDGIGSGNMQLWAGAVRDDNRAESLERQLSVTPADSGNTVSVTFSVEGTNPATLSLEYRNTTTDTVLYSESWTSGSGGTYSNDANYTYLAGAGPMALASGWNDAYNTGGANATQITRVIMTEEAAPPALVSDKPTLTSRTTTTNTVAAVESGGLGSYSRTWHAERWNPNFTPPAETITGTGATLTHLHGDSPTALETVRGLQPVWFYKARTTDGDATVNSPALPVQTQGPPAPTAVIREDILAYRTVILGRAGDSITGGATDLDDGWTEYTDRLSGTYGIPAENIVFVRVSASGSALLHDWLPDSHVYNETEGHAAGGNGYPDGTPRLLTHYVDRLEAAATANPEALVVASFMLGTNDIQGYTDETGEEWMNAWQAVIEYIRETRGHPEWIIVIDGMPYGTAGTVSTDEKVAAWFEWQTALMDSDLGPNVHLGQFGHWYHIYNNPDLVEDGIHLTTEGSAVVQRMLADGLAYSALRQVTRILRVRAIDAAGDAGSIGYAGIQGTYVPNNVLAGSEDVLAGDEEIQAGAEIEI